MKKVIGAMLVAGLAAGAANAARIGTEWGPGASADPQNAFAGLGSVIGADIVVDLIGGETWSTTAFEFETPNAGAGLAITGDIGTAVPGWATASNLGIDGDGALGKQGVQVATAATLPLQDSVSGPGRFVLATYDIAVAADAAVTTYDIVISEDSLVVLDGAGGTPAYDRRYAGPGGTQTEYSGYYSYGIGSPDTGKKVFQQPRNPLFLETPEPASLALLALGGIALLRRR